MTDCNNNSEIFVPARPSVARRGRRNETDCGGKKTSLASRAIITQLRYNGFYFFSFFAVLALFSAIISPMGEKKK